MKEKLRIFSITLFLVMFMFIQDTYAVSLNTFDVQISKNLVRPGEEVTVQVNFGEALKAYTVKIAYDDNIFDYVSSEGGTAVNTFDKIIMSYGDTEMPVEARGSVSVTFRAKSSLTTTNPTNFVVTSDNMKNADGSMTYDPITTGFTKDLIVEPEYEDYEIKLTHIDTIVKGKPIDMILSYSSAMGRPYAHARLVAEVATAGGTAKLLGTDQSDSEHDIIQDGWGAVEGYEIGGKGVTQELHVRAIFSDIGDYTITLKLIDKENGDTVIAQRSFPFTAVDEQIQPNYDIVPMSIEEAENGTQEELSVRSVPEFNHTEGQVQARTQTQASETSTNITNETTQSTPNKLPKTGINVYIYGVLSLIALTAGYIYFNKK